jgi:hypothetical protein
MGRKLVATITRGATWIFCSLSKTRQPAENASSAKIGYLLAATGEAVPSIMAYTESEWERLRRSGSPFRRAVERDEVQVLRTANSLSPNGIVPNRRCAPRKC